MAITPNRGDPTELARALGIKSGATLSQYKKGKNMGAKMARKIEIIKGLPEGWMDRLHEVIVPQASSVPMLPEKISGSNLSTPRLIKPALATGDEEFVAITRILQKGHADITPGACGEVVIEADEPLAFSWKWIKKNGWTPQDLIVMSVLGGSMEPTLLDGDVILVDQAQDKKKEGVLCALWYQDEIKLKRLQRGVNNAILLLSDNPIYAPLVIEAESQERLDVIGKVVWRAEIM